MERRDKYLQQKMNHCLDFFSLFAHYSVFPYTHIAVVSPASFLIHRLAASLIAGLKIIE
jgi:hypothetical protein